MKEFVTHDVRRFILEKPEGYSFVPGQATELSVDEEEWRDRKHPFTFTSLNGDRVLEFTVKIYPRALHPDHTGMTEKMGSLDPGARIILRPPWGTIHYKGPGTFIAAGAGITPFIAIFRQLSKEGNLAGNRLILSNKKAGDVILEKELRSLFPPGDLMLLLTREKREGYGSGHIDREYLKKNVTDLSGNFYLCGPKKFVAGMKESLQNMGASVQNVVFEQ